jgi:hypothetical protein
MTPLTPSVLPSAPIRELASFTLIGSSRSIASAFVTPR